MFSFPIITEMYVWDFHSATVRKSGLPWQSRLHSLTLSSVDSSGFQISLITGIFRGSKEFQSTVISSLSTSIVLTPESPLSFQ